MTSNLNFKLPPAEHIASVVTGDYAYNTSPRAEGTTFEFRNAAIKTVLYAQQALPPSQTPENEFVAASVKGMFTIGKDFASQDHVKPILIGLAVLTAGGVVYYTGKFICDKFFGNDNKVELLANAPLDDTTVNITYEDGRDTQKMRGPEFSGSLDWRNITEIKFN